MSSYCTIQNVTLLYFMLKNFKSLRAFSYLRWQGEQDRTWSPLICPVETLIPLLCEGAGAPGCSSSLLTARRQSSLLAFEVGADLKGPSSGFLQA